VSKPNLILKLVIPNLKYDYKRNVRNISELGFYNKNFIIKNELIKVIYIVSVIF
jgi:hypothetical protein